MEWLPEFDVHHSPNGIIEYKGDAFNGNLKGKILVVRYVNNSDIVVPEPGGDQKDIVCATEGISISGLSDFLLPLDLTEDTHTGNIYISEFGGEGSITLIKPADDEPPVLVTKE